jgi:glycosyltransferase involved in cell wall biosynthesis
MRVFAMKKLPRITVVTASFNQGRFIGRTIESVLAQDYPDVEHIVVDGMSTDETPQILASYPHLRIIREHDNGQAEAINKGMRAASGEILCFLNSDDTLLPGAFERVAREIDPERGRHVIMGRCRFTDEEDNYLGIEHPSAFESHRRVLEIWKGYCIPQPAVFWSSEVWQRCGPLAERDHLLLDYDLFCRFSKNYRFWHIDQPLATYRLHQDSKTSAVDDDQRLEAAIRVSRRYWGPVGSPSYMRVLFSYLIFRLNRQQRAAGLLQRGREAWRQGRRLPSLMGSVLAAFLGPDVFVQAFLLPGLKSHLAGLLQQARTSRRLFGRGVIDPRTQAWREFVDLHADGLAPPTMVRSVELRRDDTHVHIKGNTIVKFLPRRLTLRVFLDERELGSLEIRANEAFEFELPLPNLECGKHQLSIVSSRFAVPHNHYRNYDFRPVSFKLDKLELVRGTGHGHGRPGQTAA